MGNGRVINCRISAIGCKDGKTSHSRRAVFGQPVYLCLAISGLRALAGGVASVPQCRPHMTSPVKGERGERCSVIRQRAAYGPLVSCRVMFWVIIEFIS